MAAIDLAIFRDAPVSGGSGGPDTGGSLRDTP